MSRILFQLTALATTVFVITILAMVAMMLGDPMAPVAVWFNSQGTVVLVVEVVAIVLLGLAAMTVDRRETLRAQSRSPLPDAAAADPGPTGSSGS